MLAARVEAKRHFGLRWLIQAEALRADRHAAVAADADGRFFWFEPVGLSPGLCVRARNGTGRIGR